MLKGILFDLGSTLIEFDNTEWSELEQNCLRSAYEYLSSRQKVPAWEEFAPQFFTKFHMAWLEADRTLKEIRFADWVSDYLQQNGMISQDGIGPEFLKRYYQPIADQISLIEGAPQILEEFKREGLKIGLVSNSSFPTEYHLRELELFGIKPYFDFMLFSHDFGYRKPFAGLFKLALAKLELKPEQTVFIGDRLREDIAGAQQVGMKAILRFKPGRDYSYKAIPDAVIHHLSEIPKAIQKLV